MPAKKWRPVGLTITACRPMTPAELAAEGWDLDHIDGPPMALELSDGSMIYPSRDPEGNGGGTLFVALPDGSTAMVVATR